METSVLGDVIERVRQMAGYKGEYQHTIDEIRAVERVIHKQVHRLARTYMERAERYLQFGGSVERNTSYEIAHILAVAALTLDGTADAVRERVLRVWTDDYQARDRGELPPLKRLRDVQDGAGGTIRFLPRSTGLVVALYEGPLGDWQTAIEENAISSLQPTVSYLDTLLAQKDEELTSGESDSPGETSSTLNE